MSKKPFTHAGVDYRFMMIKNVRGKTNHIVYYNPVKEQFLPLCRAQKNLKYEEGLKSRRYILSKHPVEGAELCKTCAQRLMDTDLVSISINFDRHLIELPRKEGESKARQRTLVERGLTPEEYAEKMNELEEK